MASQLEHTQEQIRTERRRAAAVVMTAFATGALAAAALLTLALRLGGKI